MYLRRRSNVSTYCVLHKIENCIKQRDTFWRETYCTAIKFLLNGRPFTLSSCSGIPKNIVSEKFKITEPDVVDIERTRHGNV